MSNEPLDPNEDDLPVEPIEDFPLEGGEDGIEEIEEEGDPIHPDPIKP